MDGVTTAPSLLSDGTDEELRQSVLDCFEPWQPRPGAYYAVRISDDLHRSRRLPSVWSLVGVQAHEGATLVVDLLFDPFVAYREMLITDWFAMWRNGRHIMEEEKAYHYKLLDRDQMNTLKANRNAHHSSVSPNARAGAAALSSFVKVVHGKFHFG